MVLKGVFRNLHTLFYTVFTVVYEASAEHQHYIYFEQDGMVITLANWLNGRVPLDVIEQMRCSICKE